MKLFLITWWVWQGAKLKLTLMHQVPECREGIKTDEGFLHKRLCYYSCIHALFGLRHFSLTLLLPSFASVLFFSLNLTSAFSVLCPIFLHVDFLWTASVFCRSKLRTWFNLLSFTFKDECTSTIFLPALIMSFDWESIAPSCAFRTSSTFSHLRFIVVHCVAGKVGKVALLYYYLVIEAVS